jgi:hypothetical protein
LSKFKRRDEQKGTPRIDAFDDFSSRKRLRPKSVVVVVVRETTTQKGIGKDDDET